LFTIWYKTGEVRNEEMVIIARGGDRRTVLLRDRQEITWTSMLAGEIV
jgi:hypothetical protein